MAAVGAGYFKDVVEGSDAWLKITRRVEPLPDNAAIYNEYYETYHRLYRHLAPDFAAQARIVNREYETAGGR